MKKEKKTTKGTLPESGSRGARRLVQARRVPLQSIVLRTLYATGVIGLALVATNAVRLFELDQGKAKRKRLYARISQARTRLEDKGLIRISGSGRETRIQLTDRGTEAVSAILANHYQIPEPALWDGQWRIVVFDVREKRRRIRNMLRRMLTAAEFYRLQDSFWIRPYPCDEFVEILRANLRSGVGEMLLFTTDPFVGDTHLRDHFDLKH